MFHSARIRLTLWYLLIIMVISGLFSIFIYTNVSQEFTRIERFEKVREKERDSITSAIDAFRSQQKNLPPMPPNIRRFNPQMIQESRMRIILTLVGINGLILLFAGFAGYFLAGRTLKPIQDMVDEQNRFVTDASHELRTPLTALKSSIEVSLRDKKLTANDAREILESSLDDVNNLQVLSDSLIQLTQYPQNTKKQFSKISLNEVIHEAIKKVSVLAKNKGITIHYDGTKEIIFGEKLSLVELFVIILATAIQYSSDKSTIAITSKKTDGKIHLAIADEGMGIDKKDIPHIFDRFYRADKSRSKGDTPGYGLGLSIAKQIVILHNGTIRVESDVKKGTTFFITFSKVS